MSARAQMWMRRLAGWLVLVPLLAPLSAFPQTAVDPNVALLQAAGAGDLDAVRGALRSGADVNHRDAEGWSALLFAAIRGHGSVVDFLLAEGADVDAKNSDGATPLMGAAVMGESEISAALVEAGADLAARNVAGATARVKAEEYGHTELAALLAGYEAAASAPPTASAPQPAQLPEPVSAEPVALEPETVPEPTTAPEPPPPVEVASPSSGEIVVERMRATYVLVEGANLRDVPDASGKRLGSLPSGKEVVVTGKVVGAPWYRIDNGGAPAFVFQSVIGKDSPPQAAALAQAPGATPEPEPERLPAVAAAPVAPVAPPPLPQPSDPFARLSGKWASVDNPHRCTGEFVEIDAGPKAVTVVVHSGGDAFALAEGLAVTRQEANVIEAGTPPSDWRFIVSGDQLEYARAGRDPAHYSRCR